MVDINTEKASLVQYPRPLCGLARGQGGTVRDLHTTLPRYIRDLPTVQLCLQTHTEYRGIHTLVHLCMMYTCTNKRKQNKKKKMRKGKYVACPGPGPGHAGEGADRCTLHNLTLTLT